MTKTYLINSNKPLKKDYFGKQVELTRDDLFDIASCIQWCRLEQKFLYQDNLRNVFEKVMEVLGNEEQ